MPYFSTIYGVILILRQWIQRSPRYSITSLSLSPFLSPPLCLLSFSKILNHTVSTGTLMLKFAEVLSFLQQIYYLSLYLSVLLVVYCFLSKVNACNVVPISIVFSVYRLARLNDFFVFGKTCTFCVPLQPFSCLSFI